MRARASLLALAVLGSIVWDPPVGACGPYLPFWWITQPEEALAAPVPHFASELDRLDRLPATTFRAVPSPLHPDEDPGLRTLEAEVASLRRALAAAGRPAAEVESLVASITAYRSAFAGLEMHAAEEEPSPAAAELPPDLPAEFRLYLEGAAEFHAGDREEAKRTWQRLLALPEEERRFRSVWAAYMLGRMAVAEDPEEAVSRLAEVRRLAAAGADDPLGLAAESLGWQGRVALDQGDLPTALHLYAQQHSSGDTSAAQSLQRTAWRALWAEPGPLARFAADPLARDLITAALLAAGGAGEALAPRLEEWTAALERAAAIDAAGADRLAWAAYQAGAFETSQRLLARAPATPIARWIEAKLLLRAGRLEEGRALLVAVAPDLPSAWADGGEEAGATMGRVWWSEEPSRLVIRERTHAEEAVVAAAAGDYGSALEAFLAAREWPDAAWLAERVLTEEELTRWLALHPAAPDELRALAGRRLLRAGRSEEAARLLPPHLGAAAVDSARALGRGADPALSREERSAALWEAARIARWSGFDLLATELEPDWRLLHGDFALQPVEEQRAATAGGPLAATADELRRAAASRAEPDRRFHYRYVGAELAWQAAALLPDGDPRTVGILCEAGTWLALRDPDAADRFYKAMVRRGGATELARQADARRWFPPGCGVGRAGDPAGGAAPRR